MPETPTIRYARTDDGVDIAYWTIGRGPAFVMSPNVQLSHLRDEWKIAGARRFFEAIARSHTLVRLDHRGSSLSGPASGELTIDALVTDIEAVVRKLGLERFSLYGHLTGGLPSIAYAARHPDQVSQLVLWSSFARDAAHGLAPRMRSLFEMASTDWELFTESISQAALGWSDAAAARQWAEVIREACTQEGFLAFLASRRTWDVSEELSDVHAPTLVLHDDENALASEERARELTAGIQDARLLHAAGVAGYPDESALAAIAAFVGTAPSSAAPPADLTPREKEILVHVARGASNAEIAESLFVSINTVTRHLTHIYAKMGVRGRAQAVRLALDWGLSE